jgi:hypothetical protein
MSRNIRVFKPSRVGEMFGGAVQCALGAVCAVGFPVALLAIDELALLAHPLLILVSVLGALLFVNGMSFLARCQRMTITLSENHILVGRLFGAVHVPYSQIIRVSRGVDCTLILRSEDEWVPLSVDDSYFNSMSERESFIRELCQRAGIS